MRVVRAAGQNVSPSDDGRLYAQVFSDGLFTDTTFTNLGGNSVQVGSMYGDLCGRDFTIEQMTLTVELPQGEGETTGYIYVEIDTSSDDVITLNSALAPFTPTYEDINTNGAIAQMVLAEYTATAVAVTSVTPVYNKANAGAVMAGSVATVETSPAVSSHSVGEYILLNGQLYLVTSAISAGETLTPGTNIRAAVIGDTLSELKSGLVVADQDGTVTTSASGTANISSIVPNRTLPVFVRALSASAFCTIMLNTNGTYWIRAVDWDGNAIKNTSLQVRVFGIKIDAIKDW